MAIRKSSSSGIPFGQTADRPTSPSIGQTFNNGTLGVQEIYTASGWLPATGANDFNVALTGSVTTTNFTKDYFSGAYTIASALVDTSYDIYLYAADGTLAGYTKTPSMVATQNFNKIVVIGGTTGDLLSFSYKTTFTTSTTTSQVTAGAFITSVSPTSLAKINDTATITGGNFATDVNLVILDSQLNEYYPKSYTRNSATSITFTRPDSLPGATYSLKVVNPTITAPTGSNLHILSNSINSGSAPSWQTAATLTAATQLSAYTVTLSATDSSDSGSVVTYSLNSGSLPTGLSLNTSTGAISGTPTGSGLSTFTIRATDSGNNYVDRIFTITVASAMLSSTGGSIITSNNFRYHLFKNVGSDTFVSTGNANLEILLVGGGGGGDNDHGGGGGAGGILYHPSSSVTPGSYAIVVGSAGSANAGYPTNGGNSTFTNGANVLTAFGGGAGSQTNTTPGSNGGCGGGGGGSNNGVGYAAGGTSTQTSNNGGTGYGTSGGTGGGTAGEPGGGGGGAGSAGANATSSVSGRGGDGKNTWATWLSAVSSLVTGDTQTVYNTGYIAGGGGGGVTVSGTQTTAVGGLGGGGYGGINVSSGAPGVANTGGGGGAFANGGSTGSDGGSGVVIIRYAV